jgi:hypothetical protein
MYFILIMNVRDIQKQKSRAMSNTTPVGSPKNEITFLTLMFIDMI